MTVGEEFREVPALRITVAKNGHHLREVAKPDTPQWDCPVSDDVYPLHGVTLDELALFLERQYRLPVANMTGMNGCYWLDIPAKAVRRSPLNVDGPKPIDQTGLEIQWQRTKVQVLVVKDKK